MTTTPYPIRSGLNKHDVLRIVEEEINDTLTAISTLSDDRQRLAAEVGVIVLAGAIRRRACVGPLDEASR